MNPCSTPDQPLSAQGAIECWYAVMAALELFDSLWCPGGQMITVTVISFVVVTTAIVAITATTAISGGVF